MVIGHDMRDSSPSLADAFAAGVTPGSLDVVSWLVHRSAYFASGPLDRPGAMFASHNPAGIQRHQMSGRRQNQSEPIHAIRTT